MPAYAQRACTLNLRMFNLTGLNHVCATDFDLFYVFCRYARALRTGAASFFWLLRQKKIQRMAC